LTGCTNSSPPLPSKPDCKDVCNHMASKNKQNFTMSLWNVVCQDKVCVGKSKKYLKYEVPKSQNEKSTTTVHFDIDVFNVTHIDIYKDTMSIAVRLGMRWEDAGLHMCNCRDEEEDFIIPINLERHIWIPDVTMYSLKDFERIKVLKPAGLFLVEKTNGTTMVNLSMDLRATVICSFNVSRYPFDRSICSVRVGSYSHSKMMLRFVKDSVKAKNITRRDVDIYVRELCKNETLNEKKDERRDGFRIILIRKGHETKNKCVFVVHLFMITAGLSLLLPGNPQDIAVDKSELLIGVVISAYYILFDIQAQTPIDKTGNNLLTIFVKYSNIILNFALAIYFIEIYIIRFGIATMRICKYCWAKLRGRNVNQEEAKYEEYAVIINRACSIANKALFMLMMIAYSIMYNNYWITAENSFSRVYNKAIVDCSDPADRESHPLSRS